MWVELFHFRACQSHRVKLKNFRFICKCFNICRLQRNLSCQLLRASGINGALINMSSRRRSGQNLCSADPE
jgi:hypothetical protein